MMRIVVFGYIRVSTEEQKTNFSLAFQRETIINYCLENQIELVYIYEEAGSGTSLNDRPIFTEMLEKVLTSSTITHVIVVQDDRFARDHVDAVSVVKKMRESNKNLIMIADNLNTENESDLQVFQLKSIISESHRSKILFNTNFGMKQRAKSGLYNGGRITGYDSIGKRLIINQNEAKIVKKIFQKCGIENWGFRKIAIHLNRAGFRTINNEEWTTFGVRYILTNNTYIGKIQFKKETYPGVHKPIISEKLWGKAKKNMRLRHYIPTRKNVGSFYLAGLIKCPTCGGSMVRHSSQNKYFYYQCCNNKNGKNCTSNLVLKEEIEETTLKYLTDTVQSSEVYSLVMSRIEKAFVEEKTIHTSIIKRENHSKTILQTKINKTYELYYESGLEVHQNQVVRLQQSFDEATSLVLESENTLDELQLRNPTEMVNSFLDNFEVNFETLKNDDKVDLTRALIRSIKVEKADKTKDRKLKTINTNFNTSKISNLVQV